MTRTLHAKDQKRAPLQFGSLMAAMLSLFCMLLLFKNSQAAIEYVTRGLRIACGTVIPALFPFMVLSELIVSGALGNVYILLRPFGSLLGLGDAGGCAYLLGILCGAPVGARTLVGAYESGNIEKCECEYLLGLSTVPSSAFLVNAVGVLLWESQRFGVLLLLCTWLSSLLPAAILFRRLKKRDIHPFIPAPYRQKSGGAAFAYAIKGCTGTLLSVTSFIVFFSVVTGTLELVLRPFSPPAPLLAALSSFFEISDGMTRIAALGNTKPAAILCALAAGWGGLSVHCQVLSVCDGSGLSLRPYFLCKACTALLSAAIMLLLLCFIPL